MRPKIESGKFYRLRNGRKFRAYSTVSNNGNCIHGAYEYCGVWCLLELKQSGRILDNGHDDYDIISEWVDSPSPNCVQWDSLPVWSEWAAMDEIGEWFGYSSKPEIKDNGWVGPCAAEIPSKYVLEYVTSWQNSLVQRPKTTL